MTPSVGLARSLSIGSSGSTMSPVTLYRRALSIMIQLPPDTQLTSTPIWTSPAAEVSNTTELVVHFADVKNPLLPCAKLSEVLSLPAVMLNEEVALFAYPVRWSMENMYFPAGKFFIVCLTEEAPFDHPMRR